VPFPLLHIDTTWNFREMIEFRDRYCAEHGFKLVVHVNEKALTAGMNPFDYPSSVYTPTMNTHALIEALDIHRFDAALGGGRRDEEKSRAKERVFSFRDAHHQWNPKNQRPELWDLYNTRINRGENIRVFPLSNWTELDIWQYIHREQIPLVPLYFAAERPVVVREGQLIMVDDERFRLLPGEVPQMKRVRFRTMGDYPLTAAHESTAVIVPEVIEEMLLARTSERQGRLIDKDEAGSMEKKKREGYF
jgi:sulfate adenylyltransferase subunit 2